MIKVLGIKIIDRIKEAGLTQGILSKYSSLITTRMGFHEVTDEVCSREAIMILHLMDDHAESEKLRNELEASGGILIREMIFDNSSSKEKSETGSPEIIGVLVEKDPQVVASVQKLLTVYGCNIRTRLGVNESFYGQPAGLIILELKGDNTQLDHLVRDLNALPKVMVRKMTF